MKNPTPEQIKEEVRGWLEKYSIHDLPALFTHVAADHLQQTATLRQEIEDLKLERNRAGAKVRAELIPKLATVTQQRDEVMNTVNKIREA